MNPAKTALLLAAALALGASCSESDSGEGAARLDCGEGTSYDADGVRYCIYAGPLIIEGFECPESSSLVPIGEGPMEGLKVCARGTPTPEHIDVIRERFSAPPITDGAECVVGEDTASGTCGAGGRCVPESSSCISDTCPGFCAILDSAFCTIGGAAGCEQGWICEPRVGSCNARGCAGSCTPVPSSGERECDAYSREMCGPTLGAWCEPLNIERCNPDAGCPGRCMESECVVYGGPDTPQCPRNTVCLPSFADPSCTVSSGACAGRCEVVGLGDCVVDATDARGSCGATERCTPIDVDCDALSGTCDGFCEPSVGPECVVDEATSSCGSGLMCLRNEANGACDPSLDSMCSGVCGVDPCRNVDCARFNGVERICVLRGGEARCVDAGA